MSRQDKAFEMMAEDTTRLAERAEDAEAALRIRDRDVERERGLREQAERERDDWRSKYEYANENFSASFQAERGRAEALEAALRKCRDEANRNLGGKGPVSAWQLAFRRIYDLADREVSDVGEPAPPRKKPCIDCGGSSSVSPKDCRCCDHVGRYLCHDCQVGDCSGHADYCCQHAARSEPETSQKEKSQMSDALREAERERDDQFDAWEDMRAYAHKLEKALRFYADEANWPRMWLRNQHIAEITEGPIVSPLAKDCGATARRALAGEPAPNVDSHKDNAPKLAYRDLSTAYPEGGLMVAEPCSCDGPTSHPCGPRCHYPHTDSGEPAAQSPSATLDEGREAQHSG